IGPLLPCPHPPCLTHLNLMGNHLGPRGTAALVASNAIANVTSLDLSGNNIQPLGIQAIANSPHLTKLTSLRLYASFPGDEGVQALIQSTHLPSLKELDISLWGMDLTHTGVRALAEWPGLVRLTRLALNVDSTGAAILAQSPYLGGLRDLSLHPG